jgi:N-acyl-D-aspartate/D-glutamate deacylase
MPTTATTKKEGTPAQVVADAYSKLVNLEGEQAFVNLCTKRLKANTSSVRDIQASIVKAGGNAPTIRKSHVQYFLTMQEIMDKQPTAKGEPMVALIKQAQKLQTAVGKAKVSEAIESAKTYGELVANTPTLATTRTKKNATTAPAPFSLETIFTKAVSDINANRGNRPITDLTTTDLQALKTLAEMLKVIASNTEKATAKK